MSTERYIIRGGIEGRERLRLLSEVMGPPTRALLAEAGVPAGASCLDAGCGGGDVAFELARLTGASGRVLGVDRDGTKIALAREESRQLGLVHAAFEVADVTAWEPAESFDVVYARFLLTHLRDPAGALATLRRHVRPGGVLIVEDIDFRGHFAEPECSALHRYVAYYTAAVQRRGADPNIGPRLPALLRDAGFDDVRLRVHQPVAMQGGIKLLSCVTLESIADAVLADGIATEDELRTTLEELHAVARDTRTVLGGPRIFQVWGRAAA